MTVERGRALVTGASSGIGAAFAEHLAAEGSDVVIVARREDRLRQLADGLTARHGVRVEVVVADLSNADGLASCRDAISAGPLDTIVLNAGFGGAGPVVELGRERQSEMVRLNCEAVVDLACHALPAMVERGRGTVIVVSSAAAWQPIPYTATYAATKAFELSFTEALAFELAGTGVQAIAVCPGPTATEFGQASGVGGGPRWLPKERAEGVVAATYKAIGAGRVRVATGAVARVTKLAAAVLPRRAVVWAAGAIHRRFARHDIR